MGIFRFTINMNQTIHESIKVAGVFKQTKFTPVWFEWRQQRFNIKEVTLVSNIKQGAIRKLIYSVVAEGNLYRLDYDLLSQTWNLASVWVE